MAGRRERGATSEYNAKLLRPYPSVRFSLTSLITNLANSIAGARSDVPLVDTKRDISINTVSAARSRLLSFTENLPNVAKR